MTFSLSKEGFMSKDCRNGGFTLSFFFACLFSSQLLDQNVGFDQQFRFVHGIMGKVVQFTNLFGPLFEVFCCGTFILYYFVWGG